jgi:WD40 repeat protein
MSCRSTGIVSGHVDNHIRFWDTRSGECTNELTGIHTAPVTCLDLSEGKCGSASRLPAVAEAVG